MRRPKHRPVRGNAGTPYGDADPDLVSLSLGANDVEFFGEDRHRLLYGTYLESGV